MHYLKKKKKGSGLGSLVACDEILALSLLGCVSLGYCFNLSEPHLLNGLPNNVPLCG